MTARETVELFAALADMKEVAYRNTLAITTLIDLLVDRGILTREEVAERARRLDAASD